MTAPASSQTHATFVVVGGGIAAVSCVEQLLVERNDSSQSIALISASAVVKAASNCRQIGRVAETFDIEQQTAGQRFGGYENVQLVQAVVIGYTPHKKVLHLSTGIDFTYDHLCIATGGRPKSTLTGPHVQSIRDTETVRQLQQRLADARRIVLVGNGGIATEFVHEANSLEIIWAIKHQSISATFIDAGAAQFFMPYLHGDEASHAQQKKETQPVTKHRKYRVDEKDRHSVDCDEVKPTGSALGPDWANQVHIGGCTERRVHVCTECQVDAIVNKDDKSVIKCTALPDGFSKQTDWPVYVKLTNGQCYGCDVIIAATGVEPNTDLWKHDQMRVAEDGGLLVNDQLLTSINDIWAAGDVCTAGWEWHAHWVQMRLWTQARQMGAYAARSMLAHHQVIMLGKYNGQGLSGEHEALVRVTPGKEYVKVLIDNGSIQGAILIGETDLEETLENLILNQTDVERIKDMLLDPRIDIEDYFD